MRQTYQGLLFPFYRRGNWGLERRPASPRPSSLTSGRIWTPTQVFWFWSHGSALFVAPPCLSGFVYWTCGIGWGALFHSLLLGGRYDALQHSLALFFLTVLGLAPVISVVKGPSSSVGWCSFAEWAHSSPLPPPRFSPLLEGQFRGLGPLQSISS